MRDLPCVFNNQNPFPAAIIRRKRKRMFDQRFLFRREANDLTGFAFGKENQLDRELVAAVVFRLAAKICHFNWGDSLKVGVGMMTRGEVALIVAQKGLEVGVVDPVYFTAVILLIVVSSVATPLALKAMFTKMPPVPHPSQAKA